MGQPEGAPGGDPAHRGLLDKGRNELVKQKGRQADHEDQGNQRRPENVKPDPAASEGVQTALHGEKHFGHYSPSHIFCRRFVDTGAGVRNS